MTQPAQERRHSGSWVSWYALVAGMVYWAIHLAGMAALAPYVCDSGRHQWFHLLSVATAGLTLHALLLAWRTWRSDEGEGGLSYLGGVAFFVALTGLVAIVAEWVPVFLIDACAG